MEIINKKYKCDVCGNSMLDKQSILYSIKTYDICFDCTSAFRLFRKFTKKILKKDRER